MRTRAERAADNAAAQARTAAAAIETQRAHAQAEHERLENERELLKVQAELDHERQRLAEEHAARLEEKLAEARRARWDYVRNLTRRVSLAVVLAGANVGVNAAAVVGQVLALCIGLGWSWWAAVPLALVVESVAVNVGYFAHDKLIKGYSAVGLRLLSYGIGAGVGWFNYSHNADHELTADYAGVFGAASILSPVLWQIYSQWRHWDQMRGQDLLETRAPKFTRARWILWLGETFYIYRRAVRDGIGDRAEAVGRYASDYEHHRAAKSGRRHDQTSDATERQSGAPPAADELAAALAQWSKDYRNTADPAPAAAPDPADRPTEPANPATIPTKPSRRLLINPGSIHPVGSRIPFITWTRPDPQPLGHLLLPPLSDQEPTPAPSDDPAPAEPRPDDSPGADKATQVVNYWVDLIRTGHYRSKYALAEETGTKPTWCGDRMDEGRAILAAEGWTFDDRRRPIPPTATGRVNGYDVAGVS